MLFDKSALSPYIRFGCLSVRYFLWKTRAISKNSPAVENVVRQLTQKLLDREFYFVVASQVRAASTWREEEALYRVIYTVEPSNIGVSPIVCNSQSLRFELCLHFYTLILPCCYL